MMHRQFLKDSFIYGVPTLITNGISLFIIPLYTRVLTPGDYGVIDLLMVTTAFVNVVVTLEINQGFARLYADAKTDNERTIFSSTTLWFTIIMYSFFSVFAVSFSREIAPRLFGASTWIPVYRAAVIVIAMNGVYYMLQNQLRWRLQPRQYALTSISYTLITTGVSVFLVMVLRWGVLGILYGQLTGAVFGSVLSWSFACRTYAFIFSWNACREMLRFSTPLVFSSINVFITLYIDRVAINQFLTLGDVGLYGVGYRLASVVSLFVAGFNSSLSPLIYNRHTDPSTRLELEKIFRLFLALTLPVVAAISLFARDLVWLVTPPQYYEAWAVIPILAPALLFSSMYIFAPGMDIAKKTKRISVINLLTAAVNLIMNLVLIPVLGIQGAAAATGTSAVLMFVIYMHFSQQLYHVPHDWRKILNTIAITATIIVLRLAILPSREVNIPASLAINALLTVGCSIFIVRQLVGLSAITSFLRNQGLLAEK